VHRRQRTWPGPTRLASAMMAWNGSSWRARSGRTSSVAVTGAVLAHSGAGPAAPSVAPVSVVIALPPLALPHMCEARHATGNKAILFAPVASGDGSWPAQRGPALRRDPLWLPGRLPDQIDAHLLHPR